MPDKRWTAIFGVLVMLVAAVGPMVGAAAPTSSDATTAIDGDADFAMSPDNETTNDTNATDENETSSTAAANAFVEKLQQVVANATNDTNVSAPGHVIASYVVANNPGNAPDHAGAPNGTSGGAPDGNETDGSEGAPGNGGGNGAGNGNGPKQVEAATDVAAAFAVDTALAVSATAFDA